MKIPASLVKAIEGLTADSAGAGLGRAATELSDRYRRREFSTAAIRTKEDRAAYLTVRMPATYAACWRALSEVKKIVPEFAPRSILDLGAGPGTASWAAAAAFPSLREFRLLERDAFMVSLGKELASQAESPALQAASWAIGDLSSPLESHPADLVMISYVLGELKSGAASALVRSGYEITSKVLIIIEPGTRAGFETIEKIRAEMIGAGAMIAAPCPHEERCPMAAAGDWCHFSQRLERTSIHRQLKKGELGYEDEKFSYVAFTKVPAARPQARILRHPLYKPKQVHLTLCTAQGLKQTTITKSQGEVYRAAKKADWGNGFDVPEISKES